MTPEQHVMVRESWQRFRPRLGELGLRFYEQLFALDPTVAHLFQDTDLVVQEEKLLAMFAEILRALDRPVELVGELKALGVRHAGYGVKDGDYASVGSALLWLLAQVLGDEFTSELREAWSEAYLLSAGIMRRGAARASTGEFQIPEAG
jgi:hemoglobin-like flavoprotein